nr:hypothetical protein [Roseovarius pacificus]
MTTRSSGLGAAAGSAVNLVTRRWMARPMRSVIAFSNSAESMANGLP